MSKKWSDHPAINEDDFMHDDTMKRINSLARRNEDKSTASADARWERVEKSTFKKGSRNQAKIDLKRGYIIGEDEEDDD